MSRESIKIEIGIKPGDLEDSSILDVNGNVNVFISTKNKNLAKIILRFSWQYLFAT